MAIYTLTGTDKEISVQGRYASVKNNGTETVYASSAPDLELNAAEVVPIQAGESVIVRDCRKKLYVRGSGQIAVVSGNEPVNFFKPAPKGNGGGSGDGITQQQLNDTLKTYATNTSVDTKLEEYASKDEIPASLPADGGNADTVGGKSAEELIQSNPNLLLNPDFKVNQRGKSEYGYDGSDRYTVDQWKLQANLTLTVHNDYVTVSRHDPTSNSHTGFRQELNIPDDTSVTLQACVKGNGSFTLFHNGFSGTAEMQVQDTDGWVVVKCTGYGASDAGVLLRGTATSLDIKWIKLELGAVSTPFVPPNPLEEALKCGSLENAEQQIFYGDGVWANAPSNPNLLDNPDFKINQRGKTKYIGTDGATKAVDRWYLSRQGIDLEVQSDGVVITSTDSVFPHFRQRLENPTRFANKTLTLSAEVEWVNKNEDNFVRLGIAQQEYSNWVIKDFTGGVISMTVTTELGVSAVSVIIMGTLPASVKVKWVKLELGAVATPYVDPDPSLELLKCQRYCLALTGDVAKEYTMNSNSLYFIIPISIPMRINPSAESGVVPVIKGYGTSNTVDGFEFVYISRSTPNHLIVNATKQAHGITTGTGGALMIPTNKRLILSADLI